MKWINTVEFLKQAAVVRLKRSALRRELLSYPDALLDDIGVSREYLEQGMKAYPWRLDELNHLPMPTETYLGAAHTSSVLSIKSASDVEAPNEPHLRYAKAA